MVRIEFIAVHHKTKPDPCGPVLFCHEDRGGVEPAKARAWGESPVDFLCDDKKPAPKGAGFFRALFKREMFVSQQSRLVFLRCAALLLRIFVLRSQ